MAFAAVVVVLGAVTALAFAGSAVTAGLGKRPGTLVAKARYDAHEFLSRYLSSSGRVVRIDQHGDTVSEGQGYAMLLAVAIGDRGAFESALAWDRANLQLPDGLFAYHWQNGQIADPQPAADADLDTAWALFSAARTFKQPAYRQEGLRVASAILAQETVTVAGKIQLAAGPWARYSPAVIDPSYLSPEAMQVVGGATGDPRWAQVATNSAQLVGGLMGGQPPRLPPDWIHLSTAGAAAVGTPGTSAPPAYGLDAQRVPVWFAASCTPSDRALAAAAWPVLSGAAAQGAHLSYTLSGQATSQEVNPLGLVAAAAAAAAAGQRATSATLLDAADAQADRFHTYYGDAWTALGRVLLNTRWLSPGCPPPA